MTPPIEFIALLEKETRETIIIDYPEVEVDSQKDIAEIVELEDIKNSI